MNFFPHTVWVDMCLMIVVESSMNGVMKAVAVSWPVDDSRLR